MSLDQSVTDSLLDPISPEQPAGANLRWAPEWDRIREARRSDDSLIAGSWQKKDTKSADWRQVELLATDILRKQSKDLQIALWLTEASIKLRGFEGLRDGFKLISELLIRYWDNGLYPLMEDGPSDRASPLEWLNDKLVDSIIVIPITGRSDNGDDYGLLQLQEARQKGAESFYKNPDGSIDGAKKRSFDEWVADGHISMEMFQAAATNTPGEALERIYSTFEDVFSEFKALEKVIDEKFADAAPNFSALRSVMREIQEVITGLVEKKRKSEAPVGGSPGPTTPGSSSTAGSAGNIAFSVPGADTFAPNGSWAEAEQLIRTGQIDAGLSAMGRLAMAETSGRNRFQRKLVLAEVCLKTKRLRLARTILEELAEQIDTFHLDLWESSELVGAVWTRLYRLYNQAETSNEDEGRKLFDRLCRLDPWQALHCSE